MFIYQTAAVEFLLKYPDKWHSYSNDMSTTAVICSLVNLGIAKTNKYRQFKLKSVTKANDFINAKS